MPPLDAPPKLAKAVMAALPEYRRMRREGVSARDAAKGIEAVLRDAWPVSVPEEDRRFHRLCPVCDDTGWEAYEATHRVYREPVPYVRYCTCSTGQRMARNVRREDDEDAMLTAAGKSRRGGLKRL